MAGGRPTKYKPEFCEIAIECGKQGMGKAEIASKLGVVRETLWDWGNKKPEFSNRWDDLHIHSTGSGQDNFGQKLSVKVKEKT